MNKEDLAACERLVARWHGHDGGRLTFAVTPRFALSCSRALMEGAARIARDHDLLVQTHIAENPAEGEAVLAAHPWGGDYLGIYEKTGLLAPRKRSALSGRTRRLRGRGLAVRSKSLPVERNGT